MSKKRKKQETGIQVNNSLLTPESIIPKNERQAQVFESFANGRNLFLHGTAGTGKSLISIYLALKEVFKGTQFKLNIIRSIVPSRDIGFLPGSIKQKAAIYELPYQALCGEIFNRDDAYSILSNRNYIEFITTSFIRGVTYRDCILFLDEVQNMSFHEINSVLTRVGQNCRVIISGDYTQTDFEKKRDQDGIHKIMKIVKIMDSFDLIEFRPEDILRSGFVHEYILAKDKVENEIQTQTIKLPSSSS